ncbi:MAG: thiopurine S-methyltransferase, partial [Geminicoccaceae bacterium]
MQYKKTRVIAWLVSRRYRVAGAELRRHAVGQLLSTLGIKPRISDLGSQKRDSADGIDIFA